jgi:hypothetical protein
MVSLEERGNVVDCKITYLSFREQFRSSYFLFEDCGDLEVNKIIIHVLIDVIYCSF